MFGILVHPQTEPYIRGHDREALERNRRLDLWRGHDARLVTLDPPCLVCGYLVPGWHEIEGEDLVEEPLHDGCRSDWIAEREADRYV